MDDFELLALRAGGNTHLMGAVAKAEQELRTLHPEGGYSDTDVMERAWAMLTPAQQTDSMDHLFTCYRHHVRDNRERADLFAAAREAGKSFLEDDDLDIIEYSLSMFAGVPLQEIEENGDISVPLDALSRLVAEVKFLRFKQEIAEVDRG